MTVSEKICNARTNFLSSILLDPNIVLLNSDDYRSLLHELDAQFRVYPGKEGGGPTIWGMAIMVTPYVSEPTVAYTVK